MKIAERKVKEGFNSGRSRRSMSENDEGEMGGALKMRLAFLGQKGRSQVEEESISTKKEDERGRALRMRPASLGKKKRSEAEVEVEVEESRALLDWIDEMEKWEATIAVEVEFCRFGSELTQGLISCFLILAESKRMVNKILKFVSLLKGWVAEKIKPVMILAYTEAILQQRTTASSSTDEDALGAQLDQLVTHLLYAFYNAILYLEGSVHQESLIDPSRLLECKKGLRTLRLNVDRLRGMPTCKNIQDTNPKVYMKIKQVWSQIGNAEEDVGQPITVTMYQALGFQTFQVFCKHFMRLMGIRGSAGKFKLYVHELRSRLGSNAVTKKLEMLVQSLLQAAENRRGKYPKKFYFYLGTQIFYKYPAKPTEFLVDLGYTAHMKNILSKFSQAITNLVALNHHLEGHVKYPNPHSLYSDSKRYLKQLNAAVKQQMLTNDLNYKLEEMWH